MDHKAKIILMSHLGRPKGEHRTEFSLIPVGQRLAELLHEEDGIIVPDDCIGDGVRSLSLSLKDSKIMLLENLRFHPEETAGKESFARDLSAIASIYINDAFGVMHREHASVTGVPKFIKDRGIGLLVEKELASLGKLLDSPKRPFTAILGGAKVSDKIKVIRNLLDRVDSLVIGGAMANTFLVAQGKELGKSLVERDRLKEARSILEAAADRKVQVYLPEDFIATTDLSANVNQESEIFLADSFPKEFIAADIGHRTREKFGDVIARAKTVFWNGPLGVYEMEEFKGGTEYIANAIAQSGAFSVVGGGDSVAALKHTGLIPFISHISTGGGASLKFLEGHTLVGIKALMD